MSARAGGRSTTGGGVEVEVGGSGLLLVVVAVLGLCAASFWLGRWTVHAVGGARPGAMNHGSAAVEEGGDLAEDLTFFDRLEQAPELAAQGDERTVTPPPPAKPATAEATESPDASRPYEIQVLASSERAAAEAILTRLLRRDYPARLVVGDKDGRPIYRVRVGGYADEAAARQVASGIEKQEGLRTWITR